MTEHRSGMDVLADIEALERPLALHILARLRGCPPRYFRNIRSDAKQAALEPRAAEIEARVVEASDALRAKLSALGIDADRWEVHELGQIAGLAHAAGLAHVAVIVSVYALRRRIIVRWAGLIAGSYPGWTGSPAEETAREIARRILDGYGAHRAHELVRRPRRGSNRGP